MHRFVRGVGRLTDTVFQSGKGSWLTSTEGVKFLDMTSGIGVVNTGHCHPAIVQAAQEQCERIIHCQINVGAHDRAIELMELLDGITPDYLDRFFLTNTGAEAVENAIKLARASTGRSDVIVFQGGYHGRTIGTMGMTTSSYVYRQHFGPFMPNIHVAPFPYELHGKSEEQCLKDLKEMLKQNVHPHDVAAMVIEPVLGEGGYVPVPRKFFAELRDICTEHGILLVADEVQTGFGRTGHFFTSTDHYGVVPDILTMAKGLASGFPLAAVATNHGISDKLLPGTMGGTYAGNAVACAAAIATQKVIKDEGLLENSQLRGKQLVQNLESIAASRQDIRDIRGLGSMVGVEFVEECQDAKQQVSQACLEEGMLLLGASIFPTMRFIPALSITAEEIDQATEKFERALKKTLG